MNEQNQQPVFPLATDRADGGLIERRWIWLVYVALFGAAIPWYLPADPTPAIWFGLPYWVVISLLATIGIACFTAFVVHRYWKDDDERHSSSHREGEPS